ncbi:hypothetical protein [Aureitalea marina]|uniref:Uncharacterized protein n=1 Tax=Aureitalea marina TaxID=930804 RepID=A0A2S7KT12_9FLAO|nr:hypothetical protein [Aureitalea marina]PQB05718.1 hypothetical protein BST85_13020 [Aureitalea marina]
MNRLKSLAQQEKQSSPALYYVVLIHLLLAIICMVGLVVDDRTLMGINVWIKPLKFCISGGIYIFTVGYLTTLYPYSNTKRKIINNVVAWTLLLEILIIFFQGARGVQSHYNQSSAFDGIMFAMMGLLIAINVLIMVLFLFDAIRLKMKVSRPVQWGIIIGWAVVIAGSWVGGQMIGQMAHAVGVVDGGEGLPLLNWSTTAGDLRVAHFFGLHGIQIIPLFAWLLTPKNGQFKTSHLGGTVIFGLLYASWIGYTFYQASQALPFLKL